MQKSMLVNTNFKIMGSLFDFKKNLADDFYECVKDLMANPDVIMLNNFTQHIKTSRLKHSIDVAYYSFKICKLFRLDYKSAARAGLLHDFYLYDWRKEKQPEGYHAKAHPIVALRNAKKITTLNRVEENSILRHMWPMTFVPPRYAEAFVVSFVDKYCATSEFVINFVSKFIKAR